MITQLTRIRSAMPIGQILLASLTGMASSVFLTLPAAAGPSQQSLFGPQMLYPAGDGPRDIAAADINNDGFPDLVVVARQSDGVSILINDGSGMFPTQTHHAVGDAPYSVILKDLNADSLIDIAVSNGAQDSVSILLGLGDGTFADQTAYLLFDPAFTSASGPRSLACGDVNGDGFPDLATANFDTANACVLINAGDGSFSEVATYPALSQPHGVALADLNNDGLLDLAVAHIGPPRISVRLNGGGGTFLTEATYVSGNGARDITAGDLDGDGDIDLAVANSQSDNIAVIENLGDGTFSNEYMPYAFDLVDGTGIANEDLDRDGHQDIVAVGSNAVVLLNDGNGAFPNPHVTSSGGDPTSVAIADFDGNGMPDLAVANYADDNIGVFLNTSLPPCPTDLDDNGNLDFFDIALYLSLFNSDDPSADLTMDGLINFFDISDFLITFNAGCP